MAKELSAAKCVLLTVHYASEGNIQALHSFTPSRLDALDPDLVLRILLTYLPESIEPREYTGYIGEVASRLYLDYDRQDVEVDVSSVQDLDEEQAERKVKKLKLLELEPPEFPPHAPKDPLTSFLCYRAYRIDSETGLLNLVSQLIEPFLSRNEYIRTWYISVVLPLTRLEYEYYQTDGGSTIGLGEFEKLDGQEGIDYLLRNEASARRSSIVTPGTQEGDIARDLKGLVGPWVYGHTERKRRRLGGEPLEAPDSVRNLSNGVKKLGLDGVGAADKTDSDWEYVYRWMVLRAVGDFPLVTRAVEDWDGPSDVDLGDYDLENADVYLDKETQRKLEAQYAQAIFACCYAARAQTHETVRNAHDVLARLAVLLDFIPPPDLATTVESLPKIERHAALMGESGTVADLEPDALLTPEHALTTPRFETYMLLQMMVYSAYQFSGLGYPTSLVDVARMHFYAEPPELIPVLQRILRELSKTGGARKDDAQWIADRAKLMWLWNWGIDPEDEDATNGAGVLGKIPRQRFEEEMLKCFTEASGYALAVNLYLRQQRRYLPLDRVEHILLQAAMEAYDGASNGNKTRGGVKKANDIVSAFRPYFAESLPFQQAVALIRATHALSFYSLTLQHGVPFQPVSIRVSKDPIGLISKLLEQNPRSYTKLDDLVDIGRSLVSAGLQSDIDGDNPDDLPHSDIDAERKDAERRVTFMAIEAALREDDFETAYSYIINRLTPSLTDLEAPKPTHEAPAKRHAKSSFKGSSSTTSTPSKAAASDDDISWRAAFLAGRYRPASSTPPTLRRLEQRTELLSLALLLAPVSQLTEILAAWRRCEEELTALQRAQQQAEDDFDDAADKRVSMGSIPGNFTVGDEEDGQQPALILDQRRREVGRMSGGKGGREGDAPVSMFDLTRSAAEAIRKGAFPLRGVARGEGEGGLEASVESLGSEGEGQQQRTRRRDVVASAVSGGLASGLGWVLGATPAQQQQGE